LEQFASLFGTVSKKKVILDNWKWRRFPTTTLLFYPLSQYKKSSRDANLFRVQGSGQFSCLELYFFCPETCKACRGTKNHTARGRQTHHPSNFFVSNNKLKSPMAAFCSNEIRVSNSNFLTCFHYWLFMIFFQEGQGIFWPGHQGQKIILYLHGKDKKNFPTIDKGTQIFMQGQWKTKSTKSGLQVKKTFFWKQV